MIIDRDRVKEIFRRENIKHVDVIIILDNNCNADCKLCVAKHTIKNSSCKTLCAGFNPECLRCCDRTTGDDEFYASVNDFFSVVNGGNIRVILSGGEPTLSERLLPTLEILDGYGFGQVCIETNGAGLLHENVADELLKRQVQIILSRYGITDGENNQIFNFKYGAVDENAVKVIMDKYEGLVTVSCIPLKSCVDSGDKLIEYYNYFMGLGAVDVQFNEAMFDTTLTATNKDISEYYAENAVKVADLSQELSRLGYEKKHGSGSAFRIIKHQCGNSEIMLTAADMSRLATETLNSGTYSRYLIYPSGEVGTNYVEER